MIARTSRSPSRPRARSEPYDAEERGAQPAVPHARAGRSSASSQLTPFNFLDGAWLRNVHRLGPMDEVNSILFAIFNEELGDGRSRRRTTPTSYRDLCHSFELLPGAGRRAPAFARDPVFLDSRLSRALPSSSASPSSRNATTRRFMGMTLWLEWTVLELHRIAAIVERASACRRTSIDMHIAIDNAARDWARRRHPAGDQALLAPSAPGGRRAGRAVPVAAHLGRLCRLRLHVRAADRRRSNASWLPTRAAADPGQTPGLAGRAPDAS